MLFVVFKDNFNFPCKDVYKLARRSMIMFCFVDYIPSLLPTRMMYVTTRSLASSLHYFTAFFPQGWITAQEEANIIVSWGM